MKNIWYERYMREQKFIDHLLVFLWYCVHLLSWPIPRLFCHCVLFLFCSPFHSSPHKLVIRAVRCMLGSDCMCEQLWGKKLQFLVLNLFMYLGSRWKIVCIFISINQQKCVNLHVFIASGPYLGFCDILITLLNLNRPLELNLLFCLFSLATVTFFGNTLIAVLDCFLIGQIEETLELWFSFR